MGKFSISTHFDNEIMFKWLLDQLNLEDPSQLCDF